MKIKPREPSSLPWVVKYRDSETPVQLGDRIRMRYWLKRRTGRIVYVPGVSVRHHEMEFNGLTWVGVDFDDGWRTGLVVSPESGHLHNRCEFLGRATEAIRGLQPGERFDE